MKKAPRRGLFIEPARRRITPCVFPFKLFLVRNLQAVSRSPSLVILSALAVHFVYALCVMRSARNWAGRP